ncbi:hypothetical protein C3941_10165 [Kaistia algarum]|uniref:hypothetical protein n=1 Tax=Kaistia algarum TaxID=2083279 RepID=UPI000D4F06A0|nr:hypothetical protein [Kaistia algarum]MCX5512423.1 hypothetical protein [Kaistia algarum]PPE80503.1 hypothetical protein C3941_10165 [Kaistia algarum]
MRNLIIAVAALTLFSIGGTAFAAGRADGTVAAVNPTAGVLVFVDGRSFVFANGDSLRHLTPGQAIGVDYFGEGQGIRTFNRYPAGSEIEWPH